MMKTTIITLMLLTISTLYAQLKIGSNVNNIQPSSIIELESDDQGLPRLNTPQRDSMSNQSSIDTQISQGLLIYNTDDQCINFFDTSTANALSIPKGGDGIADEDCDCIMIFDDNKWKPFGGKDEWDLNTLDGVGCYVFTNALQNGDTILFSTNGNFGINIINPQYEIDISKSDSLLLRFPKNSSVIGKNRV